jgi:hypothetical protein
MDNKEFSKSLRFYMEWFEKNYPQDVKTIKQQIETGNVKQNSISLLEEFSSTGQREKFFWVLKYVFNRDITILFDWMNYCIDNNSNQKGVNATYSQKNLLTFLIEKNLCSTKDLKSIINKKIREDIIYEKKGKSTKILQLNTDELINNNQKEIPKLIDSLNKAFKDISKFHKIREILVENGYCQSGTYNWKDEKESNKSTIIFLLKHLHAQRYYKENRKLKNKEIQLIAKNTFGIEISESYIKQCKIEDINIIKIIPPATTL